MSITTSFQGDSATILLSGKLTFADSSVFRKQLMGVFEKNAKICVCDLEQLTFMDSSGLGMLMVALKECQQRNVQLELRSPRGDVKTLLAMTKTHERIRITG